MLLQDLGNGGSCDLMIQALQPALDPAATPARVLLAIWTMSARISFITPGLPTLMRGYVHFEAISRRYQAMMVSGVVIVATLISGGYQTQRPDA